MTTSVGVRGQVVIGGLCGGCGSNGATSRVLELLGAGSCSGDLLYGGAVPADDISISTGGLIGQNWADVPVLDQFEAIELLVVSGSARYRLRFDPTTPKMTGSASIAAGGVTAGSATWVVADSTGVTTSVTAAFSGSTNTPAAVRNAVNAAFAAAGVAPPVAGGLWATLDASNVLSVVSSGIGATSYVEIQAGAPAGLQMGTVLTRVTGTETQTTDLEGLYVAQFPRDPDAPTKVQISGVATFDIIAAGRVSA